MSNRTGVCKLTGIPGRFVDSHIIPRSFFERSREARNEPLAILSSHESSRVKTSRIGLYDNELVTADGERYFAKLDDYAAKLLFTRPTRSQYIRDSNGFILRSEGRVLGYTVDKFDYAALKLFFMSILWRISASARPELKAIKVEHEDELKQMLLTTNPGSAEEFSVLLYRYSDQGPQPSLLPFNQKLEGVKFVKFVCASYGVMIKVEKIATPDPLSETQLRGGRPLVVLTMPFGDSPDYRAMMKILSKPHNLEGSERRISKGLKK